MQNYKELRNRRLASGLFNRPLFASDDRLAPIDRRTRSVTRVNRESRDKTVAIMFNDPREKHCTYYRFDIFLIQT